MVYYVSKGIFTRRKKLMVVETGRVAKIDVGKAIIEIEKGTACAKCHAGCACDLGKSTMVVEANDPIGVHVDQFVQLSIPNESVMRASLVVYAVPLFALIIGTLVGEYLGTTLGIKNVFEILVGFGALALSLLFVRYYNNLFKQNLKNQPVITKVYGN
jgi:sigma-E factor negative regulatory protein RseC